MKKFFACILMVVMTLSLFSFTTLAAAKKIAYYDENGNEITISGMYYNSQGCPTFNADCYYLDEEGNQVYVGGCRAYYYDENDVLTEGDYYYYSNGNPVPRPSSFPNGYGCGAWYYNSTGKIVNSVTYYDDFGNTVKLPSVNRGGSCCGGRW